jgi:hypothetical protein
MIQRHTKHSRLFVLYCFINGKDLKRSLLKEKREEREERSLFFIGTDIDHLRDDRSVLDLRLRQTLILDYASKRSGKDRRRNINRRGRPIRRRSREKGRGAPPL